MNCNRYEINQMPKNRCESCSERKNGRYLESTVPSKDSTMSVSVSTRMQRQQKSLVFVLFSFAAVCYTISACFMDGGDALSQCVFSTHLAHALVAPNVVRHRTVARIGSERITKMQDKISTTRTVTLSPVTLQHRIRLAQRQSTTHMKQQSNGDIEIDRDDVDIPMSTTTIKAVSMNTENNAKSTRRWFLTAAGTTTGLVATTSMLSPSDSVASASTMNPEIDERSGNDRTSAAPVARAFEYTEENQTVITVPLAFTGQELLISYKVDGSKFKAVLDTGSPFLMIPGSCGSNTRQKSGCYQNQGAPVPKLTPTIEIFDGFQGEVNWRSAPFEFWDVNNNDSITTSAAAASDISTPTLQQQQQQQQQQIISTSTVNGDNPTEKKQVVFGVASEAIMGGPGGVFFGMIRDSDARIRPSFLGQTDVRAFRVNLATRPRTLTLSNRDLIASDNGNGNSNREGSALTETAAADYIPMTNLLRRRYGDPVGHYTARAQSIYVNGYPLVDTTIDKSSKILVIFDTGVTGMVVSRGLFNERYMLARNRREKTLFGDVELSFSTALGEVSTLRATKPLTTPFDPEQTWKKFPKQQEGKKNNVHIIVMGLAFLEGRSLTVDIDGERIWLE